MLKYSYLIIFLLLILTSCSDDEDLIISEAILGTWIWTSFEAINCDSPFDIVERAEVDTNGCITVSTGIVCNVILVFNPNGTISFTYSDQEGDINEQMLTFSINEESNTVIICSEDDGCGTITLISPNEFRWFQTDMSNCNNTIEFTSI